MLNIVIFGAGGQAGTAAAAEASRRGHHVTALGKADADITDPQAVARAAFGNDAVVVAVAPSGGDPLEFYRAAANSLAAGLLEARVNRLVWVSIASLLPNANGVAPVDTEGFPAEYRPFSLGHRAALESLTRSGLKWTAVSPAGDFDRTNAPYTGYALTLVGDLGAQITHADHARALIDLAELPGEHLGEHVGVQQPRSNTAAPEGAVRSLARISNASQRAAVSLGRRRLIKRCKSRPIAHVAAEMGISRSCASKWVNRYRKFGEVAPRRQPTAD